jgi:uncharacterized protein YggU (UPF0235/DUF167 family)
MYGSPGSAEDGHVRSGATAAEATVAIRVRPRASRTAVGGVVAGSHGLSVVVSVQEPAVDGRATKAALEAVARALDLPRSRVLLRSGARSRDKLLTIVDPPRDLSERLDRLRRDSSRGRPAGPRPE